MLSNDGEQWKKLRKAFNPVFAPSHITTFIPDILEEGLVFVEKLHRAADAGEIVEMNTLATVFSSSLGR
jgi:cytochrome P450